MDAVASEVIHDVQSYLEYLRGMGVESLACPPLPAGTLNEVRAGLGECRRCKLHQTRKSIVFGEGDEKAGLMFVGEGPGYDEDVQGRPFVGKAGQLLTKIIQSIGLDRDRVYIANIVKCRPPQNRIPEADEVLSCRPFLLRQIEVIRPKIICCLGAVAAQSLLETSEKITALRGRAFDWRGTRVIPTYHPAFLLRNPERKKDVWEDMKRIAAWLSEEGLTGQSAGNSNR